MLRRIAVTIVLGFVLSGTNLVGAFDYSLLEGRQGKICRDVERWSKAGDYEAVVRLLDGDYTTVVDARSVVATSKDVRWQLTITSLGTAETFESFAFIPIRGKVKVGGREFVVDTVLFFKINEGQWTLVNFPFLPDHFPSFGRLPVLKSRG